LYQTPKADFVLRFENLGNTHLKPEGDVTIYNMWGKKRGELAVNTEKGFGNVLPKTIRRFEFAWEGEESVFDIGRYSAVVTLAYGDDSRRNISATTYFWVVPIVPVAITLGVLLAVIVLITWLIRRYVRRALALEAARMGVPETHIPEARPALIETMIEPLKEGVVDLRRMTRGTPQTPTSMPAEIQRYDVQTSALSPTQFFRKYKLFFVFIIVILICVAGIWVYFDKVLVPERTFNIKAVTSQQEDVVR
jgi:hypothetical protein